MAETGGVQITPQPYDRISEIARTMTVSRHLRERSDIDLVRRTLNLPDEKEVIVGNEQWWQQVEATCAINTTVNAQLALGVNPTVEEVNKYYKTGGQFYDEIEWAITDEQTPFDIVLSLEPLKGAARLKYGKYFADRVSLTDEDYQYNADVIRENIKDKKILLIHVDSEDLFNTMSVHPTKPNVTNNHAVLISGYFTDKGHMQVLLIEPNDGPVWVPLEYLSQIILQGTTTFLAYRQEKK